MPLPGSQSHLAAGSDDQGPLAPETVLHGLALVFRRSAEQDADLQTLLTSQVDPASPGFHQWLAPGEFAARFGMAESDLTTARDWLAASGFAVEDVPASHDRILFTGTVAQVEQAFHPRLHRFLRGKERHFAPTAELSVPVALAPVTATILHLSDFRPEAPLQARPSPGPHLTTGANQVHYLAPSDLAVMYDAALVPATGSRSAVAVVGQSYLNPGGAVSNFQFYTFGSNQVKAVLVPNSGINATAPGSLAEGELDLEYASASAQNSDIFYVYVGDSQNYDVFDALAYAIQQNLAPVISISYGLCETLLSPADLNQFNALFMQAAAQGQTLVASSGDSGSTGCSRYTNSGLSPSQLQALALEFPADSPYVTAVGGTQMASGTFAAGANSYWSATQNFFSGASLLSYAPEVVWNEGSASRGILAGGGGASAVFPRPSWQAGVPGIAAGQTRLLPDIALQASTGNPGFVMCTTDETFFRPQGQSASCSNGLSGSNGIPTLAGGTSFAAPTFAGYLATLNQATGALGQGHLNPTLYKLAADPGTYASAFHDITVGNNACVAGATNCGAAGMSSFSAGVGYDEATGLGSIDLKKLIAAWPAGGAAQPRQITRIALQTASTSVPVSSQVDVQIRIDATSNGLLSVPGGTVSVSVDGVVVNAALPITSSSAAPFTGNMTYSFTAPASVGSHLVQVLYAGDDTHTAARSTLAVLAGSPLASGGLSLNATDIVVVNGNTGTSTVSVTPNSGYHGRLSWSLAISGSNSLVGCYGISPLLVPGSLTTTKLQLGTGAACTGAVAGSSVRLGSPNQAKNHHSTKVGPTWPQDSAFAFAAGLLGTTALFRRRRLTLRLLPSLLCLCGVALCLTGCGGGSPASSAPTPTPAQPASNTYSVLLTARDSVNTSITASTTFTLTVNN